MITVKKSNTTSLSVKKMLVQDGNFVDFETGEVLDIIGAITENFDADAIMDLKITQKTDSDIEADA